MAKIIVFSVFSGISNPDLVQKICAYLNIQLGESKIATFSDGEIQIEIDENVRSKDVFIIQSTCAPVNDHLIELLLMIDAIKRSSAKRITAVVPYFGYARQDKKVAPRVPISAKLVANMLAVAGANRVITMDLHAGQISVEPYQSAPEHGMVVRASLIPSFPGSRGA